jgi:uracil-DNA glycosylase
MREPLSSLLAEVRACRVCEAHLPLPPRPIVQLGRRAGVVIIGQAPGQKVQSTGVPWDDPSGDHLREWLAVDKATFYKAAMFSLVPMGFCYPGKKAGGDLPPRPECAPIWHERLLRQVRPDAVVLLVGQYAQQHYLGHARRASLTETVRAFEDYLPEFLPLPHPSWRSKLWMARNPWFARALLPRLRALVRRA